MVITVLAAALHNEQSIVQSKFFFPKSFIHYKALTLSHYNLPYQYGTELVVKILSLIVGLCE